MKKVNINFGNIREFFASKVEEFYIPQIKKILKDDYRYNIWDICYDGENEYGQLTFFFTADAKFAGEDALIQGHVCLFPEMPPEYWYVPGMAADPVTA